MTLPYRPWGPLDWLAPRLPGRAWSLLGVLSTEDRCSASLEVLGSTHSYCRFLRILDPAPSPKEDFDAAHARLRQVLKDLGASDSAMPDAPLLADVDLMRDELEAFLTQATPHIVLDITSMPKWWFFPFVRWLIEDGRVETLVATYSTAERYGQQLSTDPLPLAPLPTFNEPPDRTSNDELVVGIGFAPLSLREIYAADAGKIRYLFPFPPGPPNFMRNWEFLRVLETEIENRSMGEEDRYFVHMYDCANVFDALKQWTANGTRTTALAPFGPKTLSLAMCVFAIAAAGGGRPPVHVFYTQPRSYALDYSTGISRVAGVPQVSAYCLKLAGEAVYQL